ncbi:MAG TPA: hypothetical protein VII75_04970 [Thermoanaerobaculia bacterium]|nr:hypothetical protein [Thermoanaerobaculia bacterium]
MPQVEVYFHGLICFYSNEDRFGRRDFKTAALFVDDPDHTRALYTSDSTPHGTNFGSIFTNVPGGPADAREGNFQEYVPHLSDTSVSRSTILEVKPDNAIPLYLPKGDLHAANLYQYKGQFDLDTRSVQRAVCRISLLVINAPSNFTFYLDSTPVQVTGHPWVLLYNGSKKGGTGTYENHFHRYAYLTNGRLDDLAEVTDVKQDEYDPSHPGDKFPASATVTDEPYGRYVAEVYELLRTIEAGIPVINQTQCGNSQWP